MEGFMKDMLIGGTIGAISKTIMSPVERVKILMQTMDSNPAVIAGEVKPYSGIADCFRRVSSGMSAWERFSLFFLASCFLRVHITILLYRTGHQSILARKFGELPPICSPAGFRSGIQRLLQELVPQVQQGY
eukprot:NODE_914_length_1238_cov_933.418839_g682_i0.p3 GENE.NODE_914_length_1238_cov_933.418839_g682_i0~~NODE_914_length_1238_cov_933.418839_g682_i0.p3  ORF type:complete len:152 (-),score=41.21 NODE_914_length_1238_cov_933.418839_g682_i0:781-1176(-)